MALVMHDGSPTESTTGSRVISRSSTLPGDKRINAEWYMQRSSARWSEPAKTAYEDAIEILKKELKKEELDPWLSNHTSIQDVQNTVTIALKEYQTRSKETKVRRWLTKCSAGIMYYAAVFDTLSQHYPEYVSLAWGAFKFLFIAVLNHEELLSEISKAISRLADVLPRTELHSVLYPTERMQEAVASIYAKIMEFIIIAIKWCKQGKVMHSISAVIKPFKSSFKSIIDEMAERSRRVDELANAASKAEIRDLHITIRGLNKEMGHLRESLFASQVLQNQIMVDLRDQKQFWRASQLEGLRKSLLIGDTPGHESSLDYCTGLRNRRKQKLLSQIPPAEINKLKAWLEDPASSLLLAESQGVNTSSLDFAVDFLCAVREKGYPVIWALAPYVEADEPFPFTSGIIRSLILQVISLDSDSLGDGFNSIRPQHLERGESCRSLFRLLGKVLDAIPAIMVVIDLGVIRRASSPRDGGDNPEETCDAEYFAEQLSNIVRHRSRGGLKVVVASWSLRKDTSLDIENVFNRFIATDRDRRLEKMMRKPKFRGLHRQQDKRIKVQLRSSVSSLQVP